MYYGIVWCCWSVSWHCIVLHQHVGIIVLQQHVLLQCMVLHQHVGVVLLLVYGVAGRRAVYRLVCRVLQQQDQSIVFLSLDKTQTNTSRKCPRRPPKHSYFCLTPHTVLQAGDDTLAGQGRGRRWTKERQGDDRRWRGKKTT